MTDGMRLALFSVPWVLLHEKEKVIEITNEGGGHGEKKDGRPWEAQ